MCEQLSKACVGPAEPLNPVSVAYGLGEADSEDVHDDGEIIEISSDDPSEIIEISSDG